MKTQEFLLSSIKCWFLFSSSSASSTRKKRLQRDEHWTLFNRLETGDRSNDFNSFLSSPVFVARFDLNKRRIQVSSTNPMMFVYAIAGSTTYGSIVHLWSCWISLILLHASIRKREKNNEEKNLFFFYSF